MAQSLISSTAQFEKLFGEAVQLEKPQAEVLLQKSLPNLTKQTTDEKELKTVIEYALRNFSMQNLMKFLTLEVSYVNKLLDLGLWLIHSKFMEPTGIFYLLEDLLDSQTIDSCKSLFSVVESKAEQFADKTFIEEKACRLVMLRLCLEFLRRLSKSDEASFRGRILVFLANVFPLSDRSGLNTKGEYNLSNITEFENEVPSQSHAEGSAEREAIDYTFYRTFWSLQHLFQRSNVLSTSSDWSAFVSSLELVLTTFASNNSEENAVQTEFDKQYFPKFLTSSKLLNLQLKDPNFRRQILIQILIVLQTLETPIKPTEALTEKQQATITDFIKRARELLQKILPDGQHFSKAIDKTLNRENHWLNWKKDQCKSFERPSLKSTLQKRKMPPGAKEGGESKKVKLGSDELSRLWNLKPEDEYLASAEGQNVPNLDEFLLPLKEQMNPESAIEEEYKLKNNKVYAWKALRLIAKHKLAYFSRIAAGDLEDVVDLLENEKKASAADGKELLEKLTPLKQDDELKEVEIEQTKEAEEGIDEMEEDESTQLQPTTHDTGEESETEKLQDDKSGPLEDEGIEEQARPSVPDEAEEGEMKESEDRHASRRRRHHTLEEGEQVEEGERRSDDEAI